MAALIVIALRLVVPLTILRWPLAGGLASMVLDAVDVILRGRDRVGARRAG